MTDKVHWKYWEEKSGTVRCTILEQVADGDLVATRLTFESAKGRVEMMNFKRFEGGKIAEI